MQLNIDQILAHVLPWDFSVKVDGKEHKTRRPGIGELGAIQATGGQKIEHIAALLDSFFVEPPGIRWDLPISEAFIAGYMEYFSLHSQKKSEADAAQGSLASSLARQMVQAEWQTLPGNSPPR